MKDGKIIHFLSYLNIDPMWSKEHLRQIFDEAAERTPGRSENEVSIAAIVEKIMAVRGFAKRTEIKDLVSMVRQVQSHQQKIMSKLDKVGGECD